LTCLSSSIQNAITLENISNFIGSPCGYPCRSNNSKHDG